MDDELFCYSDVFTDFPKDKCPVLKGLMCDCFDCPRYAICKEGFIKAYQEKTKPEEELKNAAISALVLSGFCTDKNFTKKAEEFWKLFSEDIKIQVVPKGDV